MKNQTEMNDKKSISGGVKQDVITEKIWYKEKIIEMVEKIQDEKFLIQIHTILKKHIEKRGG